MLSDDRDARRWQTLMNLIDEGKVSVIFEDRLNTIDGGEILTDCGDVSDAIDDWFFL